MKKKDKTSQVGQQPLALLGGISAETFLAEYWQKKPLLIRGAIPDFAGLLSPDELAGLAYEEDAQARLVSQVKGQWRLRQGPFAEDVFAKLPQKNWTLLVQGVNHHLPSAMALLQQFSFIPHARLDDLMVSYAPSGGGVGPHFDSYDVFLLQGQGSRLWRISDQRDLAIVEGAPLRILQRFDTAQEWVLDAGDMLYLPPHLAHWGIAVGDCMTYSIGFRAPSAQELGSEFLAYLQERCALDGMYADPELTVQAHPAEIGAGMLDRVANMLEPLRWQSEHIAHFLGCYLSEPKPHVIFDAPASMRPATFAKKLQTQALALALKTQMLFFRDALFINGEEVSMDASARALLIELADRRQMEPQEITDPDLLSLLHDWYQAGYVEFV
jgi:50S ribosomal protein L16 3-hydroxylase